GAGPAEDRRVRSSQTDTDGPRSGIFSARGAVVMFRLRSLRTTVTLWHMSALLIVLLAYAGAVFVFVRSNLSSALDERLGDDLEWAAAMADVNADGSLKWFDEDPDGDHASPWLQVWSNGELIFRTAVAERNLIPGSEKLAMQPNRRVVAVQ